jgi:hypothetical protein
MQRSPPKEGRREPRAEPTRLLVGIVASLIEIEVIVGANERCDAGVTVARVGKKDKVSSQNPVEYRSRSHFALGIVSRQEHSYFATSLCEGDSQPHQGDYLVSGSSSSAGGASKSIESPW